MKHLAKYNLVKAAAATFMGRLGALVARNPLKSLAASTAIGAGTYNKYGDPRRPFPEYGALNAVNTGTPGYSGFGADWPTTLGGFEEEDKTYGEDGSVLPYLKRMYGDQDTSEILPGRDSIAPGGPDALWERVPLRDAIRSRTNATNEYSPLTNIVPMDPEAAPFLTPEGGRTWDDQYRIHNLVD
jgi:hypothetical protein